MKLTLPDRLLHRELGERYRYSAIKGIYGDRTWVDELDIVNELGGHSGCVNALRQVAKELLSSYTHINANMAFTVGLHQGNS